jgi:gentisate 1,2-dioxygenase
MPTIGAFAQQLPAGFATAPYRSTDATVYVCLEGEGSAQIGDDTYTFGPNDVFVVPSWRLLRLQARDRTILFSFSDRPMQQALGLWREEKMQ